MKVQIKVFIDSWTDGKFTSAEYFANRFLAMRDYDLIIDVKFHLNSPSGIGRVSVVYKDP